MPGTLLWLKDDLRIEDHQAFSLSLGHPPVTAVFIDDTPGPVGKTPRRLAFETATLNRLAQTLRQHDISCRRLSGRPEKVLPKLCQEIRADRVIAHQQISEAAGFGQDRRVRRSLHSQGVTFTELAQDGITRGSQDASATYLHRPFALQHASSGQRHPFDVLQDFLCRLPHAHYRRDMWKPGPDQTASSHLSMHLACGALSGDRVLHEVNALCAEKPPPWIRAAYLQFRDRIHWRRGFIQDYETHHAMFPVGPLREARPGDDHLLQAWREGRTGVPIIDAAMQDLTTTGWINFRLRQTVASFALELLDLDPFHVGCALGEMFDDYVPGIHWPQILLQAGLLVDRRPRVINPIKQGYDLDPDETWVRGRLSALAGVPKGFAHAPWRYDPIRFRPIVDPAKSARDARARYRAPPSRESAQASLF